MQPRSEVFSVKANFNDNGGMVVGTQTFFMGIQEISARRVRKELINHNLYLCDHSELTAVGRLLLVTKFKKYMYSHSTKYI